MFISVPHRHKPTVRWASPLLAILLAAAFLWVWMRPAAESHALLSRWGTLPSDVLAAISLGPRAIADAALHLLTALFLHADWAHLLGNLIFLLIFGLPAERLIGSRRLLVLFLLGGAVANYFAALTLGPSIRPLVGASGAVAAMMGAYLALFPNARLGVVVPLGAYMQIVRAPAYLLIGAWAILQVVFAYIGPAFGEVAWVAHAAGFVFGILFALAQRNAIGKRLRRRAGF